MEQGRRKGCGEGEKLGTWKQGEERRERNKKESGLRDAGTQMGTGVKDERYN